MREKEHFRKVISLYMVVFVDRSVVVSVAHSFIAIGLDIYCCCRYKVSGRGSLWCNIFFEDNGEKL